MRSLEEESWEVERMRAVGVRWGGGETDVGSDLVII